MTESNFSKATVSGNAVGGDFLDEVANEVRQSYVRIVICLFVFSPVVPFYYFTDRPGSQELLVILLVVVWWTISLHLLIVASPGVVHWRRIAAMIHDYGATTLAIIIGGPELLFLYAVLLWVTVGYGIRYGRLYLLVATGASLICLAFLATQMPFLRSYPEVTTAFVLTSITVPAYAYQLLKRLQEAYAATITANRAKSVFLAQASHDLRQPIHAIRLLTACLRDGVLGSEERRMVDNIDKSLQSVARLFRSLLDISTLESGQVRPKMSFVRLSEIFADLRRQNSEAAKWAAVDLRFVDTSVCVRTDAELLTTMVQNLISNALKFAPGKAVVVGCRRRKHGMAEIVVCDSGQGIETTELTRVFEEFYRVRSLGQKDTDGVGLGLSIVSRIASLMGLEVNIRSEMGKGTTVGISQLQTGANALSSSRPARMSSVAMLNGFRVLLVEDDINALNAAATLLERWGCVVNARTAIPTDEWACDLLVTDFDLGEGTTGRACIDRVRQLNGHAVPAIVITGHDLGKVRDLLEDDEVVVLEKPLGPAELRSALTTQKLKGVLNKVA